MQIVSVASDHVSDGQGHRNLRAKGKVFGYRGRTLVFQERQALAGPSRNVRDSQVW
jgi:hypothetical protein